MEEDQLKSHTQ